MYVDNAVVDAIVKSYRVSLFKHARNEYEEQQIEVCKSILMGV